MDMAETSISISDATLARLQELAVWAGCSVHEVLDQAVTDQYDLKFWEAVDAGYAALRADPEAWAKVEAERKLWDATLMDGLDPGERWTDDGNALPPASQERAL
jgi:predicted transcriptional regulator